MKKLLLLIIIPFLSFGQTNIVGGENTTIDNFPWQVATWGLQDNGFYEVCGASIINQYWIVTAAHCVYGNTPNTITIMVGSSNYFSNNGIPYSVDEIIIHPNYSNDNEEPELAYMSHDIALVRISEGLAFEFNEFVQPISLMSADEVIAGVQNEDMIATITGWGQMEYGATPETLQVIELPIVSNETATGLTQNNSGFSGNWPSYAIDESMICVQSLNNSGPCFGDSGGPMIVRNNDDTDWLLAGVFSKMGGCGNMERPSVFIKISHVKDWICENIEKDQTNNGSCANTENSIALEALSKTKQLIRTTNILGKETNSKGFQLHIYDDGSVEKKYLIK